LSAHARRAAILRPDGTVARTFGGIAEGARRWAGRLEGARVAGLRAGNSAEWVEALLGGWMAGCVVVPGDPSREPVAGIFAADADVVTDGGEAVCVRHGRTADPAGKVPFPAGTCLVKLTSGSTGEPRGIAFTGAQLLADADKVMAAMGIGENDINYGVLPFGHSYGLTNLVGTLLAGGVRLVVADDPFPRAMADGISRTGATVWPAVPTLVRACAPVFGHESGLRVVISAGAPLPQRDAREFFQATGLKVHGFYGASECGGICYDASMDPSVPEGFVGTPMPGIRLETRPAGGGMTVVVDGDSVGTGYVPANGPDQSADGALRDGFFTPSDLLEFRDGGFVVLGRRDGTINIGGKKIRPERVESALRASGTVEDAIVFALPCGPGGADHVAAAVVTRMTVGEIRRACAGLLAEWEIPRRWFQVQALPVNARGKIDRRRIARAAREGHLGEAG